MEAKNCVFIATSLDGYIADKDGGIDWLHMVPNPEQSDLGYTNFIEKMDALVMGRTTFEKVLSFEIDWPYQLPVFVLSTTRTEVPSELKGKVEFINGSIAQILESIHEKGYQQLYIDGGKTIQSFMQEDAIDEICTTTIPVVLGGGFPLFGKYAEAMNFQHIKTEVLLNEMVQSYYKRKR